MDPAGELVSETVRIDAAAVFFHGHDFAEYLVGWHGIVASCGSVTAKNEVEHIVGGALGSRNAALEVMLSALDAILKVSRF